MMRVRVIEHWKTSLGGLGLAAMLYILQSWHCQLPSGPDGWLHWLGPAATGLLGLLAKDH